jgi:hypothetical protein
MNFSSCLSSPRLQRWLVVGLLSMPLGSACSSDDTTTETPNTFGLKITALDGKSPGMDVPLHCDGTLAVTVELTPPKPDENRPFLLYPLHACGALTRCGYVRIQALTSAGDEIAHVDVSAKEGVLRLTAEKGDPVPEVGEIRASLIRGIDDEPYVNPDQSEVTASVSPTFVVPDPAGCPPPDSGTGGAGADAGGAPATGGAPALEAAGAGGNEAALGGAGGAIAADAGGAPSPGGAPSLGGVGGQG